MTSPEPLIEAIARAIFDAENEWRRMQDGLAGPIMDDLCFTVSIVEWQMKARAALAAVEQSGHVIVPKEILDGMAECVRRLPGGVWEVWTSNSYRRITATENGRSGIDGGVLHAVTHRSDGHPDLSMTAEELWALCALRNHVLAMLSARPKVTQS